mmetsp:Transcript_76036/g.180967  ORF Transcript_76036/g.180967 Transcript_76036/m.180967 type:complete len:280 (-) Transcript_76036:181-1020(-)
MTTTATGPVSSSCTLTGPTTAMPSNVRSIFRPRAVAPKIAVVAPFVTAKTPAVCCQGRSWKGASDDDLTLLISNISPPSAIGSPHKEYNVTVESTSVTKYSPMAIQFPPCRTGSRAPSTCFVWDTLPTEASTCCETMPPLCRLIPSVHTVLSSSAMAAAHMSTSLEGTTHSCLPAAVLASTSFGRTISAYCLVVIISITLSGYSRCQTRSPEELFQACTRPESEMLSKAPLPSFPALTSLIRPSGAAILRHCKFPSFSKIAATTPDWDATKTRSCESGE